MSLRKNCPCDIDGVCPYDAEYGNTCEYYCSEPEPEDTPETWYPWDEEEDPEWEDDCDYEMGFDPYLGCFTDDC